MKPIWYRGFKIVEEGDKFNAFLPDGDPAECYDLDSAKQLIDEWHKEQEFLANQEYEDVWSKRS